MTSLGRSPPTVEQEFNHSLASIAMDNLARDPYVGLKDWIRSASSMGGYLESAVYLSWLLTNRMMQISATANEPSLGELTSEKIFIRLDPRWRTQSEQSTKHSILAVQFHFELISGLQPSSASSLGGSAPQNCRPLCALLGNILLEIFSKGRSCSPDVRPCSPSGDGTRKQKKRAVVPTNSSIYNRANSLLVDSGMPLSICHLVCDLLDAIKTESRPESALTSLAEAQFDLTQMKDHPQRFLYDRTCPLTALIDTCLFDNTEKHLVGREKELDILLSAKKSISDHVANNNSLCNTKCEDGGPLFGRENDIQCETIFLSGCAGSGKSRLLRTLIRACNEDKWFVIHLRFSHQTAQHTVFAKALNDFFAIFSGADVDPVLKDAFNRVCACISATIDDEGRSQLCEIIPNLRGALPQISTGTKTWWSSIDQVGSESKRRLFLFHVVFKSLCSVGRPVLFCMDDTQWAHATEDIMKEFIINYINIPCESVLQNLCQGVLSVWAFRSKGGEEDMVQAIDAIEQSKSAKVTKFQLSNLGEDDITCLLSMKLCLPLRKTRRLAGLILSKTEGNPFFIVQYLKTIVENRMLQFSVDSCCWIWNYDVIDMQMISKGGVVELLATKFNQLPLPLMQTVKIVSCLGSQAEESTLRLLNSGHHVHRIVPFDLLNQIEIAVNEGIMEKVGSMYQFTHESIWQTIRELIPAENRKLLHKRIGTILLHSAANNSHLHLLAVDQINIFCRDGNPSPEERLQYANNNAVAAKFAISASSFEQARSYIDAGIRLLDTQHWETQYSLSLDLFELSSSVSCIIGDISAMSNRLNEIVANVKTFEDSLNASSLLAKLLASSSKYEEAITNCLSVLSALGEDISVDVSIPLVTSELSVLSTTLRNITVEQVKMLPPMTDRSKLNAMKYMSLACRYSTFAKPMLVPILSCRMVRLTIEAGFSDDSIVGLVTAGYGVFTFTDNIELGYRIGKVGDVLIEEHRNRHALRSRLCRELDCTLRAMVEPQHSLPPIFRDRYSSAMLAGDPESAIICLSAYCQACFYTGSMHLEALSKAFIVCLEQAEKYHQVNQRFIVMSNFQACIYLADKVSMNSFEELERIGLSTNNNLLTWRIFMSKLSCLFYSRRWMNIMQLSERRPPSKFNRILATGRALYEGVASLNLARQTHLPKWRKVGEEAVKKLSEWTQTSSWNFENKSKLLQAELHYLNGYLELAEESYKASILSASKHKFTNEEALAYELYGIFCVENEMVVKGAEQFQLAMHKYKEWGAIRKVRELQNLVDLVIPPFCGGRYHGNVSNGFKVRTAISTDGSFRN